MPVYEFYCADCHTVFKFLSRRINTEKVPACPRCKRPELSRQISMFAISKGRTEEDAAPMPDIDEHRFEQAMGKMAAEAERMDEEDPRQAARMMRQLYEATGLKMGGGMEEAMRRMEAGEDMDQIEADLGDVLENEAEMFDASSASKGLKNVRQPYTRPQIDETLYEL
ncbi:MAG: cytochrome C [Candidatus Entotheonella factor]|uniref:Cytochrome C n=1 Tax=Entotheonella factor TaxID=1429438 RepID=W4LHG7_ENTF1|nr:zinc ribbon domain-containing protein [Candidatus Entotheonella palauensis]ETW97339.1 MAG: cytochrome C [Candidatus Entotheonella factor]